MRDFSLKALKVRRPLTDALSRECLTTLRGWRLSGGVSAGQKGTHSYRKKKKPHRHPRKTKKKFKEQEGPTCRMLNEMLGDNLNVLWVRGRFLLGSSVLPGPGKISHGIGNVF